MAIKPKYPGYIYFIIFRKVVVIHIFLPAGCKYFHKPGTLFTTLF